MYDWYHSYKELYHGLATPMGRIRLLLQLVDGVRAERILDIGCGDGAITMMFKEKLGAKMVAGVDIAKDAITEAIGKGIDGHVVNLDSDKLPFDENSLDFIYCGEVIEHLFDPDNMLDEVFRVLKPNGLLLLTTPNIASWYDRLSLLFGYQPISVSAILRHPEAGRMFNFGTLAGREHVRFFTMRSMRFLLIQHKFRIIKVTGWMKEP
jgi:ubiquinone/menaquinone biosynthesis C-methylase UbiE